MEDPIPAKYPSKYAEPQVDTLARAKIELRQNWKAGCNCPCCGQRVELYERPIVSSAAAGLIRLVRKWRKTSRYYHVTELDVSSSGGEFARLERFGLIVQQVNTDTKKRCSGMWLPTSKGIDFVFADISVPRSFFMFDRKFFGFSEETTNIHQALRNKFNYAELMGNLL